MKSEAVESTAIGFKSEGKKSKQKQSPAISLEPEVENSICFNRTPLRGVWWQKWKKCNEYTNLWKLHSPSGPTCGNLPEILSSAANHNCGGKNVGSKFENECNSRRWKDCVCIPGTWVV